MKGQGGLTLTLEDGAKGYLRHAKGIVPGATHDRAGLGPFAEPGKAAPVTPKPLFKSRYAIVTPGCAGAEHLAPDQATRRSVTAFWKWPMRRWRAPREGHGLILRSAAEGVDAETLDGDIAAMRDLAAAAMVDVAGGPERLVWMRRTPILPCVARLVGPRSRRGHRRAGKLCRSTACSTPWTRCFRPIGPAFCRGGSSAHVEPTRALVAVDVNTGGDMSLAAGPQGQPIALARESAASTEAAWPWRTDRRWTLPQCRRRRGAASKTAPSRAASATTGPRWCWPAGRRWDISRSRRSGIVRPLVAALAPRSLETGSSSVSSTVARARRRR
jgi:ribonuclease G